MTDKRADIIIIGSGFFSVFSARLLAEQGFSVTLISKDDKPLNSFLFSLNALWPNLNDPPTRALVAHGKEVANYLNKFCALGVEHFKNIQEVGQGIEEWIEAPCFRLAFQNFEQDELKKAQSLGFGLSVTENSSVYIEQRPAYLCLCPDIFQNKIVNLLQSTNITFISEKVLSIQETSQHCFVETQSCKMACEMIILGNSIEISELLPQYKSILIPMSDILFTYEAVAKKQLEPLSFRASNGHVAGVLYTAQNKCFVKVTGPRFLLPQAGVGLKLKKSDIPGDILQQIQKYHKIIFQFLSAHLGYQNVNEFLMDFPFTEKEFYVGVDCHPCDELPLLGEFGKLGKILGNAGWLGTGFSSGIWAAKITRELIMEQKSAHLHERLKPRRFYKKN